MLKKFDEKTVGTIALVALLVLAAGSYFIFSDNGSTPNTNDALSDNQEVEKSNQEIYQEELEQAETPEDKAAVLLNLASIAGAGKDYDTAVTFLDDALGYDALDETSVINANINAARYLAESGKYAEAVSRLEALQQTSVIRNLEPVNKSFKTIIQNMVDSYKAEQPYEFNEYCDGEPC